jgi:hypothetical protein
MSESNPPDLTDRQWALLRLATHTHIHPAENLDEDFDRLEELRLIYGLSPRDDTGYLATERGRSHITRRNEEAAAKLERWRGQVVLDIDVIAEDDDEAMEELVQHVRLLLSPTCSIAEKRVVLRQFFGREDAPWQKAEMTTNASQLLDRVIQVAEITEGPGWEEATKPDYHVHRQILEEAIDRAFRTNYTQGRDAERRRHGPNLREAIANAEHPVRIATLLQEFATRYDERGESTEAVVLRDAADLVDQLAADEAAQRKPA